MNLNKYSSVSIPKELHERLENIRKKTISKLSEQHGVAVKMSIAEVIELTAKFYEDRERGKK